MICHLQEDIDDGAISKEANHPEEEEGDANNVDNQRVLRWELAPVGMDELEDILGDAVEMGGALGEDQVVLGIHVDAMFWLPSHLGHKGGVRACIRLVCSSSSKERAVVSLPRM